MPDAPQGTEAGAGEVAIRQAVARNVADSRGWRGASGNRRPVSSEVNAPAAASASPFQTRPLPPGGHSFVRVEEMVTEARPPAPPRLVPQPAWLISANPRESLVHHAAQAGRDWTFAWVLRPPGLALDALQDAIRPFGGVVLGAAGAYVRTRLPASAENLDPIMALPVVLGIGAVPAALKIDPEFATHARQQPPSDVAPVFVTLMSTDPDGRWRRALEALGAVVGAWDVDLRAYAANIPFGALEQVGAADFVLSVEPVALVHAAHDTAIPVMGADALRRHIAATGHFTGTTGSSVPVGVMDTGLNVSHPDIATGRASICGVNYVPYEDYDLWRDLGGSSSVHGHGTHVTGTILGAGAEDPVMAGMAPAVAHIRVAKVLTTRGGEGTTDNVNRAMDYLAIPSSCRWRGETSPAVMPLLVNMSLAATGLQFSGRGVGERKLDATVWGHGQLYVVAQANAGVHGVSNYATAKNSLAVGAVADTGEIASFSSHGPTADGRLAPNVVATGVDVSSARGQGRRSGYVSLNGTSMSAPAVAGIAALLMEAEPRFREQPALTRARIMAGAVRPDAFLGARFPVNNTGGPGELQNRYGLGVASARLTVLQRDQQDGWTGSAALSEIAHGSSAYVDIDVPVGASRLDVVMTWDEGPADAVTESVLNDLDLWIDAGADCGQGACGEHSSRSRVDNVEWILLEQPAPGTHRVKIVAERVHGDALQAAVAWTVIRGPSTPRLRVEPTRGVIRAAVGQPTEIELAVTVDGHVATGTTLHLGSPGGRVMYEARVQREDGTARTASGRFQTSPIPLGEIGSGEAQRLTLSHTPDRSHRVYFTASAWNAMAGTAHVDVVVDDGRDLGAALVPPGNDDFAKSATITGMSGEYGFDLILASREPGEPWVEKAPSPWSSSKEGREALWSAAARTVWFTWRAPDSGTYFFRVSRPPEDRAGGVTMSVFQGDDIASLQEVGANADSAIAFNARRDEIYRIRIASTRPDTSPYRLWHVLRWEGGHERPPNDDFANRQQVNGAAGRISGTNQGAGLEPDEFFGNLAATVWYEWTAPEDGHWRFYANTTSVRAFVGNSISDLRLVSSHDHAYSGAVFPASAGQAYRIVVAVPATETAGGTFDLLWRVSSQTLVDNDAVSDAARIQGARGSVSGIYLQDATVQGEEPLETGTQTRWWRWQAPGRGPYTWRLSGQRSPLAVLNVFSGTSLTHLRRLAGGREFVIETEPGESYVVAVGKQREASFQHLGDLTLIWGETPANDVPATATALEDASGSVSASNAFATTSADEPAVVAGHSSLWWRWTAPEVGWYRFRLEKRESLGLYGQPLLALYRMGTDGVPEFIRSTDRSYVLYGDLETAVRSGPGASYLVQVASRAGELPGNIAFDWAPAMPPAWLRYRGRVVDGDPVRSGGTLALDRPRSLALDDDGNRLFANTERALAVLRRDGRSGSVSPDRTIAYRDASGNPIDWIANARLHWVSEQRGLYAFDDSRAAVFRWPDGGEGFAETCRVLDPPRSYGSLRRIVSKAGFVYILGEQDLWVYRIDADCEFVLVQILTGEPSDRAAAEHIDGLNQPRDVVLGSDGAYLHLVAEQVLFTFERDSDTGALRFASSIHDASADEDGRVVQFPSNVTSAAADASGSFLYLVGNTLPRTAVFDLRENPAHPDFVAVVEDFHIRSRNFRTHLIWSPPSAGVCQPARPLGSIAAVACHASVHLVEWDTDARTLRVSDFAGRSVPDRFGRDLPRSGILLDTVQSPDGRHFYALTATVSEDELSSILAFQVGSPDAAPPRVVTAVRNTQLDSEGESLEIRLAELFDGEYPLTFAAQSSSPQLVTVELTGGVLTLRSAEDGEEGTVTVTVTATDVDGLSSTLTFQVTVEMLPLRLLRGWRRGWLEQEQQRQAHGDGR